jgi:DNA invertase Pin-like site-specific DNA recombinase
MFFTMLSAVAEFETEIRKARQTEGIAAARAKGDDNPFRGRPASIKRDKVRAKMASGMTPSAIAKDLGIARSSVYRILEEPE